MECLPLMLPRSLGAGIPSTYILLTYVCCHIHTSTKYTNVKNRQRSNNKITWNCSLCISLCCIAIVRALIWLRRNMPTHSTHTTTNYLSFIILAAWVVRIVVVKVHRPKVAWMVNIFSFIEVLVSHPIKRGTCVLLETTARAFLCMRTHLYTLQNLTNNSGKRNLIIRGQFSSVYILKEGTSSNHAIGD